MKEVDYTPEFCKAEGAQITGSCRIKVPGAAARLRAIEESGFVPSADGKLEPVKNWIHSSARMMELAAPLYVSVDFKKADGTEVKTFDDMDSDPDFEGILGEVALVLFRGLRPSKK